jgi:hypothetical protein
VALPATEPLAKRYFQRIVKLMLSFESLIFHRDTFGWWAALFVSCFLTYQILKRRYLKLAWPTTWLQASWYWVWWAAIVGGVLVSDVLFPSYGHDSAQSVLADVLFVHDISPLGAAALALPTIFFYHRRLNRGRPFVKLLDIAAPVLISGLALDRLLRIPFESTDTFDPTRGSIAQVTTYVAIAVLLMSAQRKGALQITGLSTALLAALWAAAQALGTIGSGGPPQPAALLIYIGGSVSSIAAVLYLLRKHILLIAPGSRYVSIDGHASRLLRRYWRFASLVGITVICGFWGFILADIQRPNDPAHDAHWIRLYASDPDVPALLEVTLNNNGIYVSPILDVPDGKTVKWALSVESPISSNYAEAVPYFAHAYPGEYCSTSVEVKEEDIMVEEGGNTDARQSQQLFTGELVGPTVGNIATAEALPNNVASGLSGSLIGNVPRICFDREGDYTRSEGHLLANFPSVGFQTDSSFNEIGLARTEKFGWEPISADSRISQPEPEWFAPREFTANVEYQGDLARTSFDLMDPTPFRSSATHIDWRGRFVEAQFDARDLAFQDEAGRRNFIAGILIAIAGGAGIASLQEIRWGSSEVPEHNS